MNLKLLNSSIQVSTLLKGLKELGQGWRHQLKLLVISFTHVTFHHLYLRGELYCKHNSRGIVQGLSHYFLRRDLIIGIFIGSHWQIICCRLEAGSIIICILYFHCIFDMNNHKHTSTSWDTKVWLPLYLARKF